MSYRKYLLLLIKKYGIFLIVYYFITFEDNIKEWIYALIFIIFFRCLRYSVFIMLLLSCFIFYDDLLFCAVHHFEISIAETVLSCDFKIE